MFVRVVGRFQVYSELFFLTVLGAGVVTWKVYVLSICLHVCKLVLKIHVCKRLFFNGVVCEDIVFFDTHICFFKGMVTENMLFLCVHVLKRYQHHS